MEMWGLLFKRQEKKKGKRKAVPFAPQSLSRLVTGSLNLLLQVGLSWAWGHSQGKYTPWLACRQTLEIVMQGVSANPDSDSDPPLSALRPPAWDRG